MLSGHQVCGGAEGAAKLRDRLLACTANRDGADAEEASGLPQGMSIEDGQAQRLCLPRLELLQPLLQHRGIGRGGCGVCVLLWCGQEIQAAEASVVAAVAAGGLMVDRRIKTEVTPGRGVLLTRRQPHEMASIAKVMGEAACDAALEVSRSRALIGDACCRADQREARDLDQIVAFQQIAEAAVEAARQSVGEGEEAVDECITPLEGGSARRHGEASRAAALGPPGRGEAAGPPAGYRCRGCGCCCGGGCPPMAAAEECCGAPHTLWPLTSYSSDAKACRRTAGIGGADGRGRG